MSRQEEVFPHVSRVRIGVVLGALAAVYLAWILRGVLATFFFAWLVAYVLSPGVVALERRGLSRPGAVAVLSLAVLAACALAGAWVVPRIASEAIALAQSMPEWKRRFEAWLSDPALGGEWLAGWRPYIERISDQAFEAIRANLPTLGSRVGLALVGVVGSAFGNVLGFVGGVLNFLLFVTVVVYFLLEFPDINRTALDLVPPRTRPAVEALLDDLDRNLKAVLRGQLSVGLVYGVFLAVGWSLVGLDFAILIGLAAGLAYLIPYVGPAAGFLCALTAAAFQYFDPFSPASALFPLGGVVVVWAIGQALESFVLTPYLVGRSAGLGPVAVLFALSVGSALAGILGILFAFPAAVIVKVFVERGVAAYKRSVYYGAG